VRERFGASVCSSILRFLHLTTKGASVVKAIISTTSKIMSHKDPPLAGAAGMAAAAAGVLAGSEETLAGAAGVAASAVVGTTVSEVGLTMSAGEAAAAGGVTEWVRAWADGWVE
jgi:hypothetical protein